MTELLDADDLAMLAESFTAALADVPDAATADAALYDLGWADLLDASPRRGAALAFGALGATGAAAGLLDDVVVAALDLPVTSATAVVLPAPHSTTPAARRSGGSLLVDGLLSARVDVADRVLVPLRDELSGAVSLTSVGAAALRHDAAALDPARPYRRAQASLALDDAEHVVDGVDWEDAVAAGQVALAHQLVAAARWMLAEARTHALDRVQFGRPIAAFQALRHKLAESLVAIEGAAAVADLAVTASDPLVAALSKSLAGRSARDTAKHAQQILAGIGFTTEHRFHLWLKRALVLDTLLGSSASLPADIGARLVADGGAPRLLEL